MSIQGSVKTSKGNLQTIAWIAFGIGAPQILFLQDWEVLQITFKENVLATIVKALAQSLNGAIVICALLAGRKVYSSVGKSLALATAGLWAGMLILSQISSRLFMQSWASRGYPTDWYQPLESLKYDIGLEFGTHEWRQWVILGGTISTIIWVFIAVKLGKLKNDVRGEPVYVQNQSAFVANTPTYQPVVNQQSSSQGNFCSNCGAKSSGPVGGFCSSCGARLCFNSVILRRAGLESNRGNLPNIITELLFRMWNGNRSLDLSSIDCKGKGRHVNSRKC